MPFKSEKQKKYLAIHEPKVFKEWKKKYGTEIKKDSPKPAKKKGK